MFIEDNVSMSTDDLFVEPGVYKSKKGSYILVPEGSSKGTTEPSLNMEVCLVWDCDTNRTFFKKKVDLKGDYEYVCSMDDVTLVLN